MALANIQFNRGKGGLGRVRAGADHISGLLFYGAAPAGYDASGVEVVFSLEEAETKGLTKAAYPVEHYHISEFFRVNPRGQLYVGIFVEPLTHDFKEIDTVVKQSQGEIRQLGIFVTDAFETGFVSAIDAVVKAHDQISPLSAILTANIAGVLDLTTLTDIRAGTSSKVSVDIGQSGKGTGKDLFGTKGHSIGTLGALLGTVAVASVHESVSWLGKFNIAGNELDVLAMANGDAQVEMSRTELDALDDKGYVFPVKYPGYVGSFFSSSKTASGGDYDSIEKNRTIDKAIRLVRSVMLPRLNSPVYLNDDGTLADEDVNGLEALANSALDVLLRAGELSAGEVIIDPAQDVLSTDTLTLTIRLLPVGVLRYIDVNIGFTTKIS